MLASNLCKILVDRADGRNAKNDACSAAERLKPYHQDMRRLWDTENVVLGEFVFSIWINNVNYRVSLPRHKYITFECI